MAPVIGFKLGTTAPTYNYAYSGDLDGRYYFISDWTYADGLWYASMHTDVLATYKSEIGNSYEYILRSSAAYDGYIPDMLFPLKHGCTSTSFTITDSGGNTPWPINANPNSGGYYIVGIVNGDGSTIGGVSYYAFNNASFRSFMSILLNSINWTTMDFTTGEISEELYKSLFNPMQYLVSCIWTPITPPIGSQVTSISFGWWTLTGLNAYPLTDTYTFAACSTNISHHTLVGSRGHYLDAEPFTKILANNGPFGTAVLDPSIYIGADFIEVYYRFDFISGRAMCRYAAGRNIAVDDPKVDQVVWCDFAVPIQLSQVSFNALGAAQSVVGAASGLLGGIAGTVGSAIAGNAAGAVGSMITGKASAVSGIISAADCMLPKVQSTGVNGGFSCFQMVPEIQFFHWDPVSDDNTDLGRPLCRRGKISTYAGYLLIADPNIATSGTDAETARVREFMASGFFYE